MNFLELFWWWLVNIAGDREAETVARMLYLRERPAARFLAEEQGPVPWAVREPVRRVSAAERIFHETLDNVGDSGTIGV